MSMQSAVVEKSREQQFKEAKENVELLYSQKPARATSLVKGKIEQLFQEMPLKSFKPMKVSERTTQIISYKNRDQVDLPVANKTAFQLDFSKMGIKQSGKAIDKKKTSGAVSDLGVFGTESLGAA